MFNKYLNHLISKLSGKLPLQTVLIVAFVSQILAVVGLTGWLSFHNEQQAIDDLASQLRREVTARIHQHLKTYMAMPHLVNQINVDAIRMGLLDLENLSSPVSEQQIPPISSSREGEQAEIFSTKSSNRKNLEHYFWNQIQQFKTVSYIGLGTEKGGYVGIQILNEGSAPVVTLEITSGNHLNVWETDSQANLTKLKKVKENYDPRIRPWYKVAVGKSIGVWSEIYPYFSGKSMTISANLPIYDNQGNLLAVASADNTLSQISQFLSHLKISLHGQTFIMERTGMLVATSASEKPFRVNQKKIERFKATDSHDTLTRATAQHLAQHFGDLNQINHDQQLDFVQDGERQFLQVLPFTDKWGLDWLIVAVVPEAYFMERINTNTKITFLLLIGALILAILIGIRSARWIVQPIVRLSHATQQLSTGEWNCQLPIERADEIGHLARAFNRMVKQLETSFVKLREFTDELQKLNQAYERFVPREFLNVLNKQSVIDVQLGDHVETEMTILFSDIRNFTMLSENMTPSENFNFINAYLSRMEPIINEHQGFIDKYIGDAIMALFPTNADEAVRASIAMLKMLALCNQDKVFLNNMASIDNQKPKEYQVLEIGIGLNTGPLMLGTVGGKNRMDGTVIADAVNLASRVEGLTKTYGAAFLITEQTYQELENASQYHIRVIDCVKVKGKTQMVTVYEVFDADPPALMTLKLKTSLKFEEGFKCYHQKQFEQAQVCFEQVLQINENDIAAQVYLSRCQA